MGNSISRGWPIIAIVVGALLGPTPSLLAQATKKEPPPPKSKPQAKTKNKETESKTKKGVVINEATKKEIASKDASKKSAKPSTPTKKPAAKAKPLTKEEKEIVQNIELLLLLELLNDYELFDEEPK